MCSGEKKVINNSYKIIMGLLFINLLYTNSGICNTGKNEAYLSQDFVDSSVQRAFYILNEAASVAGVGFRQKEAIQEAKNISNNLKKMAKGDPNERYILWKTGELDAQIYLEERDLVYQKMQKGQITVNKLISRFNNELGKPRPDFATLRRIHVQMGKLDIQKANEIASSFNQRYKAISREVLYSLEKALMTGDYSKARDELGYCLRNKTYLTISDSKYNQLENKLENLTIAQEELPQINFELKESKQALLNNDLGKTRKHISSIEYRFDRIKKNLPKSESIRLKKSLSEISRQFSSKEDSLVNLNIRLLQNKGVNAADEFLRNVLRPSGVSRDKIAYVDKAILSVSSPDNPVMKNEIEEIVTDEKECNDHGFTNIYNSVKQKAQNRMDSLMLAEQQRMQREEIKRAKEDSIALSVQFNQQQFLKEQELASHLTVNIYTLLEQNKFSEASSLFENQNSFLKKHLPDEGYEILKTSLNSSQYKGEMINTISYIEEPANTSENLIENKKLRANKEKAQQVVISIYSMLEKNEIVEAYNRFNANRKPLHKYLDSEVFEMLETTVIQAYTFNSP